MTSLLEWYDKLKDKSGGRHNWKQIAGEVSKQIGARIDQEKCRLKIRSLRLKFMRHKHRNSRGKNPIEIDPLLERVFSNDVETESAKRNTGESSTGSIILLNLMICITISTSSTYIHFQLFL